MSTNQSNITSEAIWKAKGKRYQLVMNEILGDRWYDAFPRTKLGEKIEFALFGPPSSTGMNSKDIEKIRKLENHITLLTEKRMKSTYTIHLNYTFIFLRYKNSNRIDIEVLFRLPKSEPYNNFRNINFVDSTCRTYNSWEDYLMNNRLLKCDMCYPLYGVYLLNGDGISVGFAKSPACKVRKTLLKGLDVTSSVAGIAGTGISLASLAIPIAGPLVAGAVATVLVSSTYEIGRNVDKLVDRKKHNEGVGLKDEEARKIWFDVATSALGAVSVGGRAIVRGKSALKLGRIIIETETLAARFIKVSSIVVNGLGIVNMLIDITKKFRNGDLTFYDLKQFSRTFSFFFNVYIAESVIELLVRNIASLSDARHDLSFSSGNTSTKIVKQFQQFRSNNNIGILLTMVKCCAKWLFSIDLSEMDSIVNRMVFAACRTAKGEISMSECSLEFLIAYKHISNLFRNAAGGAITKVRRLLSQIAGEQFIEGNPDFTVELCLLSFDVIEYCEVEDIDDYFTKLIFFLIHDFYKKNPYNTGTNNNKLLSETANFVCDKLKQLFDSEKSAYLVLLQAREKSSPGNFDLDEFNESFGIPADVDIPSLFLKRAIRLAYKLINENTAEMRRIFHCITSQSLANNNIVTPCLETRSLKLYKFKGPPGQEALTDNQYWRMVHDLSGLDFTVNNSTMTRVENLVYVISQDENEKNQLSFFSYREGDCVSGFFCIIKI